MDNLKEVPKKVHPLKVFLTELMIARAGIYIKQPSKPVSKKG